MLKALNRESPSISQAIAGITFASIRGKGALSCTFGQRTGHAWSKSGDSEVLELHFSWYEYGVFGASIRAI